MENYEFNTSTQHLSIKAEDETDAVNMAEQFTDDEIISDSELDLYDLIEEQPNLFI